MFGASADRRLGSSRRLWTESLMVSPAVEADGRPADSGMMHTTLTVVRSGTYVDAVRCAHALRPEGIEWPRHDDGRVSFRLEDLSAANALAHDIECHLNHVPVMARPPST